MDNISITKWTEPLPPFLGGVGSMGPASIAWALQDKLLSAIAIDAVQVNMKAKGEGWGDEMVQLNDGSSAAILELSLHMLEQAYALACSRFDEPELAIISVYVMCRVAGLRTDRKTPGETLMRVAQSNEKAEARVARTLMQHHLTLEPTSGSHLSVSLPYFLEDLRFMIQTKRRATAKTLFGAVISSDLRCVGSTASMELMYLMAESLFSMEEHSGVIVLAEEFPDV
jgi:hypothetical protein